MLVYQFIIYDIYYVRLSSFAGSDIPVFFSIDDVFTF